MAKIEPANLLLTDKDGNTGLVKSLTNKDITTLKGVITNVDYIKDFVNANGGSLPVQGDIHLTATDEEGNNNDKTLLGTSGGILQWNNQNLVRSVNGLVADAHGNVNVKVFELQRDVQKSLTGTLSATLTNTDGTATKTVTKNYSYYNHYNSNIATSGESTQFAGIDTFTYGVTFSSTPSVRTSDSTYFRVGRATTTNAEIYTYVKRTKDGTGSRDTRPAGTATATGQIISSKVVSKTVSKTVNYGVTYKDVPTISNVVGCTVTDIGTTACTVTTTLSTTLSSGQSVTLKSDFSFDVIGDAIISSED